jgi:hypothetical protein
MEEPPDMSIQLPDSIATFFQVSNGAEAFALRHCFTDNAVVRDEGHTHEGYEAIQAWLLEAKRKYTYNVEALDVTQQGSSVKVCAKVSGNFPGSPVPLDHVFRLTGGKIDFLEIH